MPQYFDPSQSMNALAQGMNVGSHIRDKQTQNALSPMVAKGDFKSAMNYAGSRGDLGQATDMRGQYEAQLAGLDEAERAKTAREAAELQKFAFSMKGIKDPAQRQQAYNQAIPMLQGMELNLGEMGEFYLNDQALDIVIDQGRTLEDMLKGPKFTAPVPVTGPDGKQAYAQFNDQGTAPNMFDGITKPPPERPWWAGDDGSIDPAQAANQAAGRSPGAVVNVNGDAVDTRPEIGTVPPGYQAVFDANANSYRFEQIPGSQSERDAASLNLKSTQRLAAEGEQFGTMIGNIDSAIEMVDGTSAGFGAMTSGIPTSPARNLRAKLETVQALIGFDKLNEMRQTSPTGGALGNVTERELQFLQSVRGSLDTGQSPEQLKQTLSEIKDSLSRLQEVREIAFRMENGMLEPGQAKPRAVTAPPDPAEVDALVNKYLGGAQ